MKLRTRLTRLEATRTSVQWVPPIIFHSIIEPSKNGPKEIGAVAKIRVNDNDLMVWRGEDETNENFELRVLGLQE